MNIILKQDVNDNGELIDVTPKLEANDMKVFIVTTDNGYDGIGHVMAIAATNERDAITFALKKFGYSEYDRCRFSASYIEKVFVSPEIKTVTELELY